MRPARTVVPLVWILGGFALVACAVSLGARMLERSLMYFPETQHITPESEGLIGVSEVTLVTPDGARVLAWKATAKPGQPTILYFHGNGGSFGVRAERIRRYVTQGYGVFMMTYRGFGGSTGHPSERNNVADANVAYDTLVAGGTDASDIIVYGESLGTGVAVQVAARHIVRGLILDAPYTSMVDLANLHYPMLPARWLMRDRYDTMSYIAAIKAPLLVLHGARDDIVPVALGRAVFAAAPEPKQIIVLPEAGHSDHYKFGSYDMVFRWIGALRAGRNTDQGSQTSAGTTPVRR